MCPSRAQTSEHVWIILILSWFSGHFVEGSQLTVEHLSKSHMSNPSGYSPYSFSAGMFSGCVRWDGSRSILHASTRVRHQLLFTRIVHGNHRSACVACLPCHVHEGSLANRTGRNAVHR